MDIVVSVVWEGGRVERRVDVVAASVYARRGVETPFLLRAAAKLVGVGRGIDAALAAEWQDELQHVETIVNLAAAKAASTPEARADTLGELKTARARYTRFLSEHAKRLEASGVAAAAVSETRRATVSSRRSSSTPRAPSTTPTRSPPSGKTSPPISLS